MESDAELIERFQRQGDRDALDALFRRHVDSVYRIARRVLRNDAEVEDATQATFIAALRGLGSLNLPDRFAPWLRGIAIRIARKALRTSGSEARRRALLADRSISAREHPMNDKDLEAVFRALDDLPEDVRLPILLHHCEGLSYEEIGDALAMPRGTVGTNIHRGLDRLRSALPSAVSLGVLVTLLAASDAQTASAATVEAVSRLARSASATSRPWPLKTKASLTVVASAGVLLLVVLSGRSSPTYSGAVTSTVRAPEALRNYPTSPEATTSTTLDPDTPPPLAQAVPRPDPAEEQIARNERNATANLKTLLMSEADFRANDRDENKVYDFWTADVSGLYRMGGGTDPREQIKLIPHEVAAADAVPLIQSAELAPALPQKPSHGYWFRMLPVASARGDRCASEFAIAAYPAEYGASGRRTFIINEGGTYFSRDLAGTWPPSWPSDEELQSWEKEPPPRPKAAPKQLSPEEVMRARAQASRLAFICDLNRPIWDSKAHVLSTLRDAFKLEPARWAALLASHERLIERARRLESDRAQVRQSGEKTEIEILPFPQEATLLVAEWTRELESVLTPEQMRDFDAKFGSSAFPLSVGQFPVRITLERIGDKIMGQERVVLPSGEEIRAGGYTDSGAVPKPYRHLLR